MKQLSLMIALLLMVVMVKAQTEPPQSTDEMNTIFGKEKKTRIGWVIGIDPGYTQFSGRDVWMAGLSVGMIINHNFTLGLTGRGWCNRNGMYYPNVTDTTGAYLEGGYGGLLLEYTLFPKSMVHVTFPVLIGGGDASYITDPDYSDWDEDDCDEHRRTLDKDQYFIVEPGVRAEINILKFMRLNAGVSYRYVAGLDLINTSSTVMNNFTATVGLKFGKF